MYDDIEALKERVLAPQTKIENADAKDRDANRAEQEAARLKEGRQKMADQKLEVDALSELEFDVPDGVTNVVDDRRQRAEDAGSQLEDQLGLAVNADELHAEADELRREGAPEMMEEIQGVVPKFLEDLHNAKTRHIETREAIMLGGDDPLPVRCEEARRAAERVEEAKAEVRWLKGRASYVAGAARGLEDADALVRAAEIVEEQIQAALRDEDRRSTALATAGARVLQEVERGRRSNSGVQALYEPGGPFEDLGPLPGSAIIHQ